MAKSPPVTSKSLNLGKHPFDRAPRTTDDTGAGFAVSDLWNFNGRIFKAKDVTAAKAVWTEYKQDRFACLLDVVRTAAAAYGLVKLRSGYSGAACRIVRASDSTTFDVPFLSDNYADAAAARAFLAGTTGKYDKLYDHSGNALDATQTTDANRPPVGFKTINGRLVLTLAGMTGNADGTPNISNAYWFDLPAGLSVTRNAVSVLAMLSQANQSFAGTTGQVQGHVIFELGSGSGNILNLYAFYSSFDLKTSITGTAATLKRGVCGPQVIAAVYGSSSPNIQFWQNNETITSNAFNSSGTSTGGRIGMSTTLTTYPGRMDLGVFVVYGRTLTATEIEAGRALISAQWGIAPQHDMNFVIESDSLMAGYGTANLENACDQLERYLGERIRRVNLGYTGYTLQNMLANYSTRVGASYVAGKRNVLFIVAGGNDIIAGRTAAQVYADLTALIAAARATGYAYIVVGTIMPASTFYGLTNADSKWINRDALNVLIRSRAAGEDAVLDMATHAYLGVQANTADTATFWDGAHLAAFGQGMYAQNLAEITRPAIKRAA